MSKICLRWKYNFAMDFSTRSGICDETKKFYDINETGNWRHLQAVAGSSDFRKFRSELMKISCCGLRQEASVGAELFRCLDLCQILTTDDAE